MPTRSGSSHRTSSRSLGCRAHCARGGSRLARFSEAATHTTVAGIPCWECSRLQESDTALLAAQPRPAAHVCTEVTPLNTAVRQATSLSSPSGGGTQKQQKWIISRADCAPKTGRILIDSRSNSLIHHPVMPGGKSLPIAACPPQLGEHATRDPSDGSSGADKARRVIG